MERRYRGMERGRERVEREGRGKVRGEAGGQGLRC